MKILVCISSVPDTTSKINFTEDNKQFNPSGVQFIINPNDEFCLTKAIMLKEQLGANVTLVNVGTQETEPVLRKASAIGADDIIRIDAAHTDAFFVATQLARVAKEGNYDLIITGKESIDYNGGMVGGYLSSLLNLPFINKCIGLEIEGNKVTAQREIDGGREKLTATLPLVIAGQKGLTQEKDLRIPNMRNLMADKQQTKVVAVTINVPQPEVLAAYGVNKVLSITNDQLQHISANTLNHLLQQAVAKESSTIVVFSASSQAKGVAPLLANSLQAGYVSNIISLPTEDFIVKSNVFSNKAISLSQINTPIKILGLAPNAFKTEEKNVELTVEPFAPTLPDSDWGIQVITTEKTSGKVSLDDATIVVSGGRGLKAAENWQIVEGLAEVLGAATACSKPVADMGWRPHSEHVGQTGKPVAPNLYIAIGISGAIQHLAGVNASKVKLVINSDSEAPFFKVADYGVVGDAFEVVPKLIEKLKARQ